MNLRGIFNKRWEVVMCATFLSLAFCLAAGPDTSACSNVFVAGTNETTGVKYAAVARSMDIEFWLGEVFGYGLIGDENESNINIPQSGPVKPKMWTNVYGFIGQTVLGLFILTDGVNTEGLYAGLLELPGFTQYPEFNPRDRRPELGVLDVLTYALGTARDVPDLVDPDSRTGKLLKVQMVLNAAQVGPIFRGFPSHLAFRDKNGNSAVVEWIEGKTHFYVHRAGTSEIVEIVDGHPSYRKVYHNTEGAVLTNAPPYSWHLKQVEPLLKKHRYFTGNTERKWDGAYMNGSGLFGLEGDYTPVSRFVRASILASLYPKAKTQNQAMYAAYNVLQSVIVPLGANPSPTAWVSWVDLPNSIYHFKPLIRPLEIGDILGVALAEDNLYNWQSYDCKAIAGGGGNPPKGWVHVKVQGKEPVTNPDAIRNEIKKKTVGKFVEEVFFVE
jgi:penicillin V acylase-like amidase (Ntn superfamily)